MLKAVLSFAFGGLVVFVPQGVKDQERKPTKVKVVELQDVTEQEAVLEDALVEIIEREDVQRDLQIERLKSQDPKVSKARLIKIAKLLKSQDLKVSKARLIEIAKLLNHLETMKVKLGSLDEAVKQLDVDLAVVELFPDAKNQNSQKRKSRAPDYQGLNRKLIQLQLQKDEIAEARDRLQAKIVSAKGYLAQAKATKSIAENRRRAELAIQRNADRADLEVKRNAELAKKRIQDRYLKSTAMADFFEMSKLEAELKTKDEALEAYKEARRSLVWVQDGRSSAKGRAEIAKLEREIVRMSRELSRQKASQGRSTARRTAPRPRVDSSNGVWTTRAPRASRSSRSSSSSSGRSRRARSGSTVAPRSAPNTLGVEGKVIWNELQDIHGEIRALRALLEAHMKTEARKARTGRVGRSSGGYFPGRGSTRSGVTNLRTEYLRIPPGKVLGTTDGREFTVTKGMEFFWEDGDLYVSTGPRRFTTDLGIGHAVTIPLPEIWQVLTVPKVDKPSGPASPLHSRFDHVPGQHPAPAAPVAPQAPHVIPGTSWFMPLNVPNATPPHKLHQKPKKDKKKAKSKKRKGSVVYWSGENATPAPRASKKNELRRL